MVRAWRVHGACMARAWRVQLGGNPNPNPNPSPHPSPMLLLERELQLSMPTHLDPNEVVCVWYVARLLR